ncbi:hypothetical protein ACTMS0_27195 [Micromonospora sp. H33]|uniref:hypothetical protein n=1 Tax=Micromonospora sp. H33 TaxID=3452215 RepID=UPI003F8C4697
MLLSLPRVRGRPRILLAPLAGCVGARKPINHAHGFPLGLELPPRHLPSLGVRDAGEIFQRLADEAHVAAGQRLSLATNLMT